MSQETQIKKIDLSSIYELVPMNSAATMLRSILQNYERVEEAIIVNESPDIGVDIIPDIGVDIIEDKNLKKEIEKLYKLLDIEIKDYDELYKRIAELVSADMIINLYDGYESAVAFIKMKNE